LNDIRLSSSHSRQKAKEKTGACEICGYDKWLPCLEWHHVFPELKEHTISAMVLSPIEDIEKELKKCILLCCNCHSEIHRGNEETNRKVLEIFNAKSNT